MTIEISVLCIADTAIYEYKFIFKIYIFTHL